MEIFGNLPFHTSTEALAALFEEHGRFERVNIPTDRETARTRALGFATMLGGCALRISEARGGSRRRA